MDFPKYYYNIIPDLPEKPPAYLNPKTKEEVKQEELAMLFPEELSKQEFSTKRFIRIPEELRELYTEKLGRPRPLKRALSLEKALKLKHTKIYYKREDLSPTGSHKPNTALAQLYYVYKEGTKSVTTETGAGQWGSAVALISSFFNLNADIFMVKVSYEQKPMRKILMKLYGANVYASPSTATKVGKDYIKKGERNGSLGIAISEAIELAIKKKAKYVLGSVLNSVLMHQTIIGEETLLQLKQLEEKATHVVGCVGGGSNFAGIAFPFYRESKSTKLIAVEPREVPTLTKGSYRYDFGDTAGFTPLLKMHTLGSNFIPPPLYAGGLRYHGVSPLLSILKNNGLIEAKTIGEEEARKAGFLFARAESIVPAPESAHAIAYSIRLAKQLERTREENTIVFNLSGHGLFDLSFYS